MAKGGAKLGGNIASWGASALIDVIAACVEFAWKFEMELASLDPEEAGDFMVDTTKLSEPEAAALIMENLPARLRAKKG